MYVEYFRKFAALVLTFALVSYSGAAMALTHAHEYTGFHQMHAGFDGDHDRSDHLGELDNANSEMVSNIGSSAPGHSETGFHSHSSPQFGPIDTGVLLGAIVATGGANSSDSDRCAPLHQDRPPFKPPRIYL